MVWLVDSLKMWEGKREVTTHHDEDASKAGEIGNPMV